MTLGLGGLLGPVATWKLQRAQRKAENPAHGMV
jgi:uncharacterized Tic20 family protein